MTFSRAAVVVLACGCAFLPAAASPAFALVQPAREAGGSKVDLRPKFTKGQQVRFRMSLDIAGKQATPDAGEQKTTNTQEIVLLLRVKDADPESGATLELVYESIKFKLETPIVQVDFDSSKKSSDDPMDAMLRPIVGLTLTLKTDKDGNITGISGADGAPGVPPDVMKQFAADQVVKSMLGPITTFRKGTGEAAVGESWTNTDTMSGMMGGMTINTVNTLKSHKGGKAEIDIKGQVTLDPSGAGVVTIKDSTLTGTAVWDTEAGMLDSLQTQQKLSIDHKQGDANISSTQDMKMSVKRERGK